MPDYKKNHYIPRFYLRNFTDDIYSLHGKLDFFNTKTNKYIGKIDHYSQMQEDYFYPKGSPMEKKLGEDFEIKHSTIINKIIKNEIIDSNELLELVLLMYFRTKHQRDSIVNFSRFAIDNYLTENIEPFKKFLSEKEPGIDFGNLPDEYIRENMRQSAYAEYSSNEKMAEKSIERFKKINEEILGLKTVVLKNNTTVNLISSDHPVIVFNPFLKNRVRNVGIYGLFQMGIVILLPIDPKHVIVAFDNNVYEESFILNFSIRKTSDINNINILQTLLSKEGVYTKEFDKETLNNISKSSINKIQSKIIRCDFPNNYSFSYTDECIPNFKFLFLRETEKSKKIY